MACSGCLREVRSALHRRQREETQARRSVEQQMHSQMFESLTAMLLSCELAMAVPGVPAPAVEKIQLIDNLARDMRVRMGTHCGAFEAFCPIRSSNSFFMQFPPAFRQIIPRIAENRRRVPHSH